MKQKPIVLFLIFFGAGVVHLCAQGFQVLDQLGGGQGTAPYAGLVLQGSVLFGVTSGGGATGNGNVFEVDTDGTGLSDLYDFTTPPPDASYTRAAFVLSGNTLYGAGYGGGTINSYGAIYAISTAGTGYTNLHVFSGGPDGSDPRGSLVLSSNVLYGTTQYTSAGATGDGTVFSVNTDSTGFTTLFTFAGTNGSQPYAGLVLSGNILYGTTYSGGSANLGTLFSLTTDGKIFTLLHSFSNSNGTLPAGGLVLSGGTLYGTASSGGANGNGYGTVFSIATNGSNFTVLTNFTGTISGGDAPMAGLLLSSNLLYGTTSGQATGHGGTVFSIGTNGSNFTTLYSFTGNADGADPVAPLLMAGNKLFGTAAEGGDANGDGTIFSVQLSGVVIVSQPSSQTGLSVGASAGFSVGAVSLDNLPLQYQWRLNGVNIPGATTAGLPFTNVQETNGGLVTMAVSDGLDAPNSIVAGFSVSTPISAATNDYFTNRFALASASNGVVGSSNTNATREIGEPVIFAGDPGGKSIWFKWKPPSSGVAVFTTQGSAFDTIMGVYTGTSVSTLTREPSAISDDDSGGYLTSKVTFNAMANQEYEIVVDGYFGASGSVVLSWQMPGAAASLPVILTAPPPITVASNGASVTLVCQASTGVPTWFFNGQTNSVVTGTSNVISSLTASNVGTWVAQVTSAAGTVSTQPARLQISTLEDGSTDTNSAALNKFLDSVSSPFVQTSLPVVRRQDGGDTRGFSVSQVFSTVGAAGEPGEPNIAGQIGGSPVWYVYVTPTNGTLSINTAGSSFNTLLGVFTGPGNSFATLTSVGAGYTTNYLLNGQPQVSLANVPKGQTNYIVVDGYKAATGMVQLNVALGNDPAAITTAPQSQFVLAGINATFTVTATGTTPLNYFWLHAGANIAGATNSSLTITNVQSVNSGLYTVLVSNVVSVASNSATLTLGTLPAITNQPASHTVPTNTTASLSVVAGGNPAPSSYQWLFNGANTSSTTNSLSISNFASSNQGSYSVVVSNSLGAITSSNAILLLDSPLRIGAPSFSAGAFQLQLIGASGGDYVLQTSTNLVNWISLVTNNSATGLINLTDTNAGSFKLRFYRAITH
jgi:uncharacterized repeat protein (TIGR03803 family)